MKRFDPLALRAAADALLIAGVSSVINNLTIAVPLAKD
jgi:hypothetical protein